MIDIDARVPPCDRTAERAMLGAILIDGRALWAAREILAAEHIWDAGVRWAFEAACKCAEQGMNIDPVTLRAALEASRHWSENMEALLRECVEEAPGAAGVADYARRIRSKARLRGLAKAGERLVAACYRPDTDADALAALAAGTILKIAGDRPEDSLVQIQRVMQDAAERVENPTRVAAGISTGLTDLDALVGGLRGGELIVLAARPSMGKTSLALGMIRAAAMGAVPSTRVLFASLEMTRDQIGVNMLAQITGLNTRQIANGTLPASDVAKVVDAAAQVYQHAPIAIDDGSGMTPARLRARLEADDTFGLVVVDYLQLMSADDVRRGAGRVEVVGSITRGLKAIAKEKRIPVLALAQLNRAVEGREGNRPRLSDLRESGDIEQDADVVMLLHRPEYYSKRAEDAGKAIVDVAKNRNGATGEVALSFARHCVRFTNAAFEQRGWS